MPSWQKILLKQFHGKGPLGPNEKAAASVLVLALGWLHVCLISMQRARQRHLTPINSGSQARLSLKPP